MEYWEVMMTLSCWVVILIYFYEATVIDKGFVKLNKSETTELKSLSKSVEDYETRKYPMPL